MGPLYLKSTQNNDQDTSLYYKCMIDILLNISVVFHNFKLGSSSVICWCSGSVVEGLTRDRGAAGSRLTGITALCP